jgi:hypothetical protein
MTVWARQSGVLILAGARDFVFSETVRPAPIQWVTGLFPIGKVAGV